MLVIKEDSFKRQQYSIIQSRYLYDSNFEFYGDQNNYYKDKDALYEDIYKQVFLFPKITIKGV